MAVRSRISISNSDGMVEIGHRGNGDWSVNAGAAEIDKEEKEVMSSGTRGCRGPSREW